jgi:hypothetical protein
VKLPVIDTKSLRVKKITQATFSMESRIMGFVLEAFLM